uniref:Si:ch211-119d14.3 n=1 Tax=Nothobranchius furzeri TaxID=105023 RepID=A0A1A8AH96_NOTFU
MVSKDTERECLRRKLAADADGAPLSFEVNLRQEQRQYFISVFEPHISSYCMFGRLTVHYNGVKNNWHCLCTKARKSCPHKAIAKWHLHQLKQEIFTNPESFHKDPPPLRHFQLRQILEWTNKQGSFPFIPQRGKHLWK